MNLTHAQRVAALERLYAQLPKLECQGKCEASCGPIGMARAELVQIERRIGHKPAEVAEDLVCPLLEEGRCSVYELRPMVCRMFGLTRKMACPHGCVPERWVADGLAGVMLQESLRIGGRPHYTLPLDSRLRGEEPR